MNRFRKEDKAGLYLTVIVHLVVLIILLTMKINKMVTKENSFVLDFTKQEEIERERKEIELKEDISKELDRMLAEAKRQDRSRIRNAVVNSGEKLKDDRNANDVYDQARELERKLKANRRQALEEEKTDDAVDLDKDRKTQKQDSQESYKGPSVVSYSLDGRKARKLSIPAYKCYGGGDVTVIITVNRQGRVVEAKVMEEVSEPDPCLHEFAIRAAKLSIFTASDKAPLRQNGEIVYRFVAQ